jgi:C_GCAxxG_C_C family probable redox protein
MPKAEEVKALFNAGFNCAQSMLAVYGKDLGMDYETALKIGNVFGGGIARTGETCGAVTGALMILSLRYGAIDAKDSLSNEKTHNLAGEFMKKFEARNNSVVCRDLIGFDIGANNIPEKNKIISQRCPGFIKDAAEIVEEMLNN